MYLWRLFFLVFCLKEIAEWLELDWWIFVNPHPKWASLTKISYIVAFLYLDFGFQFTASSSFVLTAPMFSSSLILSIIAASFPFSSFFSISAGTLSPWSSSALLTSLIHKSELSHTSLIPKSKNIIIMGKSKLSGSPTWSGRRLSTTHTFLE